MDSAFYLYINGRKVGYSRDSRTPAEFDITPYLQDGENLLAVEVYQYSDGCHLEDQNMFRLSGIFRDVYLSSAGTLDIRDFRIKAGLADDYKTGTLDFTAKVANHGKIEETANVSFSLTGPVGTVNNTPPMSAKIAPRADIEDRSGSSNKFRLLGSLSTDEGLYGGSVTVEESDKLDLTNTLTLVAGARINNPGLSQGGQPLVTKGDTAYGLKLFEKGDLEFFIHSSGVWQNIGAKLPGDAASKFHTYAGVYDGKSLGLFIDGKSVATKPCTGAVSTNDFELAFGINTQETARRFNGSIRRAAVYPSALTSAQLASDAFGAKDAVVMLDFAKDAEKPKTQEFIAYGGDFNDRPTDVSFCANGIVSATSAGSPTGRRFGNGMARVRTRITSIGIPVPGPRYMKPGFRNPSTTTSTLRNQEAAAAFAGPRFRVPRVTPTFGSMPPETACWQWASILARPPTSHLQRMPARSLNGISTRSISTTCNPALAEPAPGERLPCRNTRFARTRAINGLSFSPRARCEPLR